MTTTRTSDLRCEARHGCQPEVRSGRLRRSGPVLNPHTLSGESLRVSGGVVRSQIRGDLEWQRGEIFGLLGPNGAGKTTTLRMLAKILAPTGGRAWIDGVDVAADPLEARRRLGLLSGTTGLYPRLTARETLVYFGRLHGIVEDELQTRVE